MHELHFYKVTYVVNMVLYEYFAFVKKYFIEKIDIP